MAIKYKMLQKAAVGERFPFSWLVFNSWDYAIAEVGTASSKMKDITMSLKVYTLCAHMHVHVHMYKGPGGVS